MPLKVRAILENTLCLVLLALFALLACFPIVTRDAVPLDVRSIFFCPPWEEARPQGLEPPAGLETSPQAQRYYPWYAFMNETARRGELPLWNPLEGGGHPFLAVWRTRCLSPFSLPFYLLPIARALQLSVLLKLVVAGWCAFYAARRFGFRPPLALFVGAVFELSGHVYLWNGWPLSDVVPWLPLLLVFVERLALGQTRRWPLGAIVVGLMALGGDPETLGASMLLGFVYLLLRNLLNRTEPSRIAVSVAALAAAVVAGLGLAAVQIAPYIEFLDEAASTGDLRPATLLEAKDIVLLFLPGFFGAGQGLVSGHGIARDVNVLRLLHVGLFQMWLLCLWFSLRSYAPAAQRQRIEAMLLTTVVMGVLAILSGRSLTYVPGLALLRVEHLLVGNALVFAMTSAAAADEWLHLNAEECKATLLRLLLFAPALLLLAVAAIYFYRDAADNDAPALWLQLLTAFGLSLALLLLLGVTLVRPSVRIMGCLLVPLALLSMLLAFHQRDRYVAADSLFPETSFITSLKQTGARVSGSDALKKWPLAGNLIPQVYTPSGIMLKRYSAALEWVQARPLLLRLAGAPALLLTKHDIQGAFASIRPMLAIQRVFPSGAVLFTDLSTRPRAWMDYDERVAETLDPEVLIEQLPQLIEDISAPDSPARPQQAKVAIEEPEQTSCVRILVEQSRPGVLVLADVYYVGWKATVDGQEKNILPAYGLLRGVQVDEGKHVVEFVYSPFSLKLGLGITIAAALIILIESRHILIEFLRNRRRRA